MKYGKHAMYSLQTCAKEGRMPCCAINKLPYWRKLFIEQKKPMLDLFFQDTLIPLSGPHPTRLVQIESGYYTSNDTCIIEMNPEWTKRRCYGIYAAKMGWDIQRDSIGRITKNPISDSDPEVREKM
eukprot:6522500-Ditylum_brightwellii.AAC.1